MPKATAKKTAPAAKAPRENRKLGATYAVACDLQRELCRVDPEQYGSAGKLVAGKAKPGTSPPTTTVDLVPGLVDAKIKEKL